MAGSNNLTSLACRVEKIFVGGEQLFAENPSHDPGPCFVGKLSSTAVSEPSHMVHLCSWALLLSGGVYNLLATRMTLRRTSRPHNQYSRGR